MNGEQELNKVKIKHFLMVDNILGYCHNKIFLIYVIAKFFIWLSYIRNAIKILTTYMFCCMHISSNTLCVSYSHPRQKCPLRIFAYDMS